MLCSLAVIEKEKVKLNKKLEDMLKIVECGEHTFMTKEQYIEKLSNFDQDLIFFFYEY